jgi:hypothetical protein
MEDEKLINRKLIKCGVLIFLAIIIPFTAFFVTWRPREETLPLWFQRSGSIVTVFAVYIQFELLSIQGFVNPNGIISEEQGERHEKYHIFYDVISLFDIALIIIGTLIWGYGDIFWRYF